MDEAVSSIKRLMTFEEADKLHWQILKLIWRNVDRRKPTYYEIKNLSAIQRTILDALATGQYVTIFKDGELKAFASWWRLDHEGLDAAKEGKRPLVTNSGDHVYVTEATASKGYMQKLVKALRDANGRRYASWHRSKNGKWFEGSKYGIR